MKATHEQIFIIPDVLDKAISEVDSCLEKNNSKLSIDFKNCQFISVDGLEWLEEILVRADSKNINVTFCNLKPEIYKVFKIARVDVILKAIGGQTDFAPFC